MRAQARCGGGMQIRDWVIVVATALITMAIALVVKA
jgi:hypothetical protein